MKRLLKTGMLSVIMLSLAVSLSACEGKKTSSKDSKATEVVEVERTTEEKTKEEEETESEEETKIDINSIDIDWSRLTGYAFVEPINDILEANNVDPNVVFLVTIPDDMANLYYLDDTTYKGHQNVKLLRNGEPVVEEEVDGVKFYEVVQTVRTSNRIVFAANYKLDGSLYTNNYSIQAPDGKEYFIVWQFTNDEEFLEKELDVYKTASDCFMWYPSRDFATKRPNELIWDLKGMDIYVEGAEFGHPISGPHQEVVAIDGMDIDWAYVAKPSYYFSHDIGNMSWTLSIKLPEGVSEDEFLDELDDIGLYMKITMDDVSKRIITIHEGHNPNYAYDRAMSNSKQ